MAGYSGTPLVQKLGIAPGMRVHFANAPRDYFRTLGPMPTVLLAPRLQGPLDFVQYFAKERSRLEARFPSLAAALTPAGMLWVLWPKRASTVATDLTEDVIRAVALPHGLVDVKVCAVDATWSGLKLVWRKENRGPQRGRPARSSKAAR